MGRVVPALVLAVLASLSIASSATAKKVPECAGQVSIKKIDDSERKLRSAIVGGGGRMYVSGRSGEYDRMARLWRIDRPGAKWVLLASATGGSGGLAWRGRKLLWGVGSYDPYGIYGGPRPREADILEVNPSNGKHSVLAHRVGSANGVATLPDGSILASNSFLNSSNINRVSPRGWIERPWAEIKTPSGMVVGKYGEYMYVTSHYSVPPRISTVEIDIPENTTTWYQPTDEERKFSYFSSITRDGNNNFFVGAIGGVWKVRPGKKACVFEISDTLGGLTFGRGSKGFQGRYLFAVGEGGGLYRISGARRAIVG